MVYSVNGYLPGHFGVSKVFQRVCRKFGGFWESVKGIDFSIVFGIVRLVVDYMDIS